MHYPFAAVKTLALRNLSLHELIYYSLAIRKATSQNHHHQDGEKKQRLRDYYRFGCPFFVQLIIAWWWWSEWFKNVHKTKLTVYGIHLKETRDNKHEKERKNENRNDKIGLINVWWNTSLKHVLFGVLCGYFERGKKVEKLPAAKTNFERVA